MTCKMLLAVAVAVLCVEHAFALPIGPSKDWCKTSAKGDAKRDYALFPSGKCALCVNPPFVYGPDPKYCNELYGDVCDPGPIYQISKKKDGWKYCVCGGGWYGSPTGDNGKPKEEYMSSGELGCSICPIFATTSRPGAAKTAAQCNICRSDLQFTGKGPFCDWDPTKFAFPNCSIPEPWETYGAKLPGKGGCGCAAGTYGSWPDCRPCPPGLTAPAGNGKKCTCNPKVGFLVNPKKPGKCTCDTKKGFYPTFQNATTCVKCSSITGSKVVSGKCLCDASKGYGINLATKAGTDQPICLKCSSIGAVLHKASGQCRCPSGKGVEIGYETPYGPPYCVACGGKNGTVVNGICSCAKGYARTSYYDPRVCIPCTGGNKRPVLLPEYPQPICSCAKGYDGTIFTETDGECRKCGAGATADSTKVIKDGFNAGYCSCIDPHAVMDGGSDCNACEAGYVKNAKTGKCQFSAACKASKWVAKFWTGSSLGKWNGTFFPNEVIDKKVTPTKTTTLATLDVSLLPTDIPGSGKFAVLLEVWLWGKKGAPYWLKQGQGRYTSTSALVSMATGSKVINMEGTQTPSYFEMDLSISNLNSIATYGDSCELIRIFWWGTKKTGSKLVAKLVRRQGVQGWF